MCRPQLILIKLSCGVCRNTSRKSTEAELRTLQVPICLEKNLQALSIYFSRRGTLRREQVCAENRSSHELDNRDAGPH